jgi:putative membrane-bound dehydrogenase-like protein
MSGRPCIGLTGAGSLVRRAPAACAALALAVWAVAAAGEPEIYDSEKPERGRPMPAAEAARTVRVPPGFAVEVLAAEPVVRNPIAMAWDGRGRLWVAENFTYAEAGKRFELALRDRVLVFSDDDGDGAYGPPRVFDDSLQMLTGVEIGHGGVWLMCPPRLLFVPDRDGDAVPDGPAETVLDGFDVAAANHHNFANGLRFGPDGWLYGRCGHSCPGRLGAPGCPEDRRLAMHGGIWRYSPRTGRVEVLATGTTNPWGHDWNAEAECFFINTVNGHLWHLIPGAHFRQMHGTDPLPHGYETIDHHADHFHFDTGAGWRASRDGAADDLGGGHAHSGCMIYAGTNWPAAYRDRLFTLNFHGRRANQEILERSGSGYVARHGQDCFLWADRWFRGMELASGPDGSVAVLDWSDTGECHESDGVHRGSGRIYRVVHGRPVLPEGVAPGFDVRRLSDTVVAKFLRHPDGWWASQARLVLAERGAGGGVDAAAIDMLEEQFAAADRLATADGRLSPSAHRVRALLGLHVAKGLDDRRLRSLLDHGDEHVRTWAIRLLTEGWPLDAAVGPVPADEATTARVDRESALLLDAFERRAAEDPSGLVRLALGSTIQRLPVALRPRLAAALVARTEDAADHNLPLLVWHGLAPVAASDPAKLVAVALSCAWPTTRRLIARRLARSIDEAPLHVERLLAAVSAGGRQQPDSRPRVAGPAPERLEDVLEGLAAGLAGWRKARQPAGWDGVAAAIGAVEDGRRRERCRRLYDDLSVLFGDGRALEAVQATAVDPAAPRDARREALATLIEVRPPDLRAVCEKLVGDRDLRVDAVRGLALYDDAEAARAIVEVCRRTQGQDRDAVVAVLLSRPTFAGALLDAVEAGRIASSGLSAYHVRQLHALGDATLSGRVDGLWGKLRDSPAEKRARMEQLAALVAARQDAEPSLSAGRLVFRKTCNTCHRLYGEGGGVGPDLTGSGRHDLGYLLHNIVDPSAVVNRDWCLSIVELADGRTLSGVVTARDDKAIVLQGLDERRTIPVDEIESITLTDRSPMPDGLLDGLTEPQIRDLIAYLRHPTQVPLPDGG